MRHLTEFAICLPEKRRNKKKHKQMEGEACTVPTCAIPAQFACSKCTSAFYCSPECQRADWPRHKTECKTLAAAAGGGSGGASASAAVAPAPSPTPAVAGSAASVRPPLTHADAPIPAAPCIELWAVVSRACLRRLAIVWLAVLLRQTPSARAEALKAEGNAAVASKDFPRAVSLYSQAIELVPEEAIYYSNRWALGPLARRWGWGASLSASASDTRSQCATPPCFPPPPPMSVTGRSMALLSMGGKKNATRALQDADSCVALKPEWVKAHLRRLAALLELERSEEALAEAAEVDRLEPGSPDAARARETVTKVRRRLLP
jgi:hypothetical protein